MRPARLPPLPGQPRRLNAPLPMWRGLAAWLLLAATLWSALPARAAELSERDARAVRSVIEAQLKAFAADDARAAWAHASPAIQGQFGEATAFMDMVRSAYPMVVRPASTAFFKAERVEGGVLQRVQLRDRAGVAWLASYQLELQADKRWRISGCVVRPADEKSST